MPRSTGGHAPAHLVGLAYALAGGLGLCCLHLAERNLSPAGPAEAGRALFRLGGGLALMALAWFGRYMLFPELRRPGVRWLWAGGLLALAGLYWRLRPEGWVIRLLYHALLLGVYLAAAEPMTAVRRGIRRLDLAAIPARQEALAAVRRLAAKLCTLVALMLGVSLYLLSVDYLFDYFLYSAACAVVSTAAYILPLAVLDARLGAAVSPAYAALGALEEQALATDGPRAAAMFRRAVFARQALARSARTTLRWSDWLHPAAAAALLFFAALLHRW